MTCAEFQELAAGYALGVLDPAELAACQQHLGESKHQGCLEALRRASENAVLLSEALPPATPSPAMWSAIERRLGVPARSMPLVGWLLAAAAVLLIVWLGFDRSRLQQRLEAEQIRHGQALSQCVAQLDRLQKDAALRRDALALLELPGTRLIAMTQSGSAQANVIYHSGEKRAFFVGRNLAAPAGKDYELWMIRGDKKIAAGLLHADATGALVSVVDPAVLVEGPPDAMAVTLEAAGGKPQPEGPIVLVGKVAS
jgi:anti-sigma-K factor RskA